MRVYNRWLKVSIIAALAVLLLAVAVTMAAGGFSEIFDLNDLSVSSIGGPVPTQPTAMGPISLGIQDDGKTVTVNKGDTIRFTFAEYGAEDSWKMRNNPDVKVVSDLVMESYPMQHALTVTVLAPTDIYFDRASAPDGGKTKLAYHFTFYGKSDLLPTIPEDMMKFSMPTVATGSGYASPVTTDLAFNKPSTPFAAQWGTLNGMPGSVFNGYKISWDNLFGL